MNIRLATKNDVRGIMEIYNSSILHTTSVYSEEPYSYEMMFEWFKEKVHRDFPILVADDNGSIAGFATFGTFRNWPGFRFTVEHSLHIHIDFRRMGIAKKLLEELCSIAANKGYHAIVGGIDAQNIPSIELHKQLGFEEVAHFKEVGFKFDKWLDLKFLQKILLQNLK